MRADQLLLSLGLAPTRSAAQRLIDARAVEWEGPKGWTVVRKCGEDLPEGTPMRVTDDAELRYVSRGGLKLEGALAKVGVSVAGLTALDMGQSAGGFTDVLLKAGATHVTGIDVGHSQLHETLKADPRVTAHEGMHVKDYVPAEPFDLVVGDLSFISMIGTLKHVVGWLKPQGQALLLIKPQYELGPKALNKNGIVKDKSQYVVLKEQALAAAEKRDLVVKGWFESPVTGGDGNTEFFIWVQKP
ncbi:TlyA family RNA methyltransferase [Roseateles sp.]|uniref:TlyA family RNA methyltransferase n=1 Tax=Roseateles sp. TaxID=1971397 RepID=UPI002F4240E4